MSKKTKAKSKRTVVLRGNQGVARRSGYTGPPGTEEWTDEHWANWLERKDAMARLEAIGAAWIETLSNPERRPRLTYRLPDSDFIRERLPNAASYRFPHFAAYREAMEDLMMWEPAEYQQEWARQAHY